MEVPTNPTRQSAFVWIYGSFFISANEIRVSLEGFFCTAVLKRTDIANRSLKERREWREDPSEKPDGRAPRGTPATRCQICIHRRRGASLSCPSTCHQSGLCTSHGPWPRVRLAVFIYRVALRGQELDAVREFLSVRL